MPHYKVFWADKPIWLEVVALHGDRVQVKNEQGLTTWMDKKDLEEVMPGENNDAPQLQGKIDLGLNAGEEAHLQALKQKVEELVARDSKLRELEMSKNTKLDIRLRQDQKDYLQALSDSLGMSKGQIISDLIDEEMDKAPNVGPATNKEQGGV